MVAVLVMNLLGYGIIHIIDLRLLPLLISFARTELKVYVRSWNLAVLQVCNKKRWTRRFCRESITYTTNFGIILMGSSCAFGNSRDSSGTVGLGERCVRGYIGGAQVRRLRLIPTVEAAMVAHDSIGGHGVWQFRWYLPDRVYCR